MVYINNKILKMLKISEVLIDAIALINAEIYILRGSIYSIFPFMWTIQKQLNLQKQKGDQRLLKGWGGG